MIGQTMWSLLFFVLSAAMGTPTTLAQRRTSS
jgi:hypothetical protein